ncbi:MAG: cobyrinate a,c-diamide synthase [Candidatus Omnitrophota bacterium]|nr:cobyrinate a,c-diamide synthase [Candidatus Omnitrophota bacterium]
MVGGALNYPRVVLAGANSGSGKTTLTLGLILALTKRGFNIQPFKAGPDYIDCAYHSYVSKSPCANLDSWMIPKETIRELFAHRAKEADISLIEGVMGLYDGLNDSEAGSTAELAKILGAPVILIVNAHASSRSLAALALGYKEFDHEINLKGVILNNIASSTHYQSAKKSIEKRVKIPVLGFLPRDEKLKLNERHLGLVPVYEKKAFLEFSRLLCKKVDENIEIEKIIAIARSAKKIPPFRQRIFKDAAIPQKVTIAVANDAAFNFYYQDNLDILRQNGAHLVDFSPLTDKKLPKGVNGLYIGGGFPEVFAARLAKNVKLKNDIRLKVNSGLPIYAECGGLMYLSQEITDLKGRKFPMAGILDVKIAMGKKRAALGYVTLTTLRDNILSKKGDKIRAHVFHWSHFIQTPRNNWAYNVYKKGSNVSYDGLVKKNILAGYAHLHFAADIKFCANFISACRNYKICRAKFASWRLDFA